MVTLAAILIHGKVFGKPALLVESALTSAIVLLIGQYVYNVVRIARAEWYGAEICVDTRGIAKKLPSGREVVEHWKDVTFVSPAKRVLYFRDRVGVRVSYGPLKFGGLTTEDWCLIISLAPAQNIARIAVGEYQNAMPTDQETRRFWILGIGAFAFFLGGLVFAGATRDGVLVVTLFVAFVIGIQVLVYFAHRNRQLVEKKYRPPPHYCSTLI